MANIITTANVKTFMQSANFAGMRSTLGLDTGDSPTFAGLTVNGTFALTTLNATTLNSVTEVFTNATSGTITVQAVTGALGTRVLSLPAETGTFAMKGAQVRPPGFTADGAGSALTTGKRKGYVTMPIAGTITGWSIGLDAGTATVKVWKIATGTAVPTIANVINTSGVAISSGTYVRSTTVTDFTSTAVAAGDIFAFDITAVATATELTFQLEITPTN